MENEDKQSRIIEKISKLLAMSESTNPNEAAIALERAQKLMAEYKIDVSDVSMNSISEIREDVPSILRDRKLYAVIASIISKSFGVEPITHIVKGSIKAVSFIGPNERVQTAAYAFTVVARQAAIAKNNFSRQNRTDTFIELMNSNDEIAAEMIEFATKTEFLKAFPSIRKLIDRIVRRNTSAYLHGWLLSIHEKVREFAMSNEEHELIEHYTDHHYPELGEMRRSRKTAYDRATMAHFKDGVADGEQGFQIFHGVSTDVQQKSLSHKQ